MPIPKREAYLRDIYEGLAPDGILILTEKVSSSPLAHELYYDMKRRNGVTEAEIEKKRRQLEGVLITRPLGWYFEEVLRGLCGCVREAGEPRFSFGGGHQFQCRLPNTDGSSIKRT